MPRRGIRRQHLVVMALAALIALSAGQGLLSARQAGAPDRAVIEQGEGLYLRHCAACHGVDLEGQPDWRRRRADGRLPAPPHDGEGHTWHHPQAQLFEITKFGLVPPHAPEGYASDMPAYAGVLSDDEIRAVLAYIQSRWPAEVLERRALYLRGAR